MSGILLLLRSIEFGVWREQAPRRIELVSRRVMDKIFLLGIDSM